MLEVNETIAELSQQVDFMKTEWNRVSTFVTGAEVQLTAIDRSLLTTEKRLDSLDRRFDQMMTVLNRLDSNQIPTRAPGKEVAESSASPAPVFQTASPFHSSGVQSGPQYHHPACETRESLVKKIEMPIFSGSGPYGWIARIERYFRFGNYHGRDRLDLIAVSLEGPVLNWFNSEMDTVPFTDWGQFKRRLLSRFRQRLEDEPAKRLFALRQTGSLTDYINEFEELKSIVVGVDEQNLEHIFYNGLKPEFQEVIKMKAPRGLTQHITAVMGMEDSAFCKSVLAAGLLLVVVVVVSRLLTISRRYRLPGLRKGCRRPHLQALLLASNLDRSTRMRS